MGGVVGAEGGGGAGDRFLELLGEFAGDEQFPFRAEFLFDFVEELEDAVGGFVEDDRRRKGGEFDQAAPACGGSEAGSTQRLSVRPNSASASSRARAWSTIGGG